MSASKAEAATLDYSLPFASLPFVGDSEGIYLIDIDCRGGVMLT
jgi:hypothetical protein